MMILSVIIRTRYARINWSDFFNWLSISSTFPFIPPSWSVCCDSVSVVASATCFVSWRSIIVFFAASIVFPWVSPSMTIQIHTCSACWINISPPSTPSSSKDYYSHLHQTRSSQQILSFHWLKLKLQIRLQNFNPFWKRSLLLYHHFSIVYLKHWYN